MFYPGFKNKIEKYYLLADEQNGFRKSRSCEEHMFTLINIMKNNNTVFTKCVDLKTTFDFVQICCYTSFFYLKWMVKCTEKEEVYIPILNLVTNKPQVNRLVLV